MGLEDEINEYNAAIAEEAREKERVAQEARREAIERARVAQDARREIAQRAAIKQAALDALAMEKLAAKKKKLTEAFKILDPVSFLQDVSQKWGGGNITAPEMHIEMATGSDNLDRGKTPTSTLLTSIRYKIPYYGERAYIEPLYGGFIYRWPGHLPNEDMDLCSEKCKAQRVSTGERYSLGWGKPTHIGWDEKAAEVSLYLGVIERDTSKYLVRTPGFLAVAASFVDIPAEESTNHDRILKSFGARAVRTVPIDLNQTEATQALYRRIRVEAFLSLPDPKVIAPNQDVYYGSGLDLTSSSKSSSRSLTPPPQPWYRKILG